MGQVNRDTDSLGARRYLAAIPGLKEALGTINSRGHELNIQTSMVGGEAAVARLMGKICEGIEPPIEYDEYRKLGLGSNELLRPIH